MDELASGTDDIAPALRIECPMCGEIITEEPQVAAALSPASNLLLKSRIKVLVVCFATGAISLLNLVLFAYQLSQTTSTGLGSWQTEVGRVHLLGHIVRAACFGGFSYSLWRLSQSMIQSVDVNGDFQQLFAAQNFFWTVLVIALAGLIAWPFIEMGFLWYLFEYRGIFEP
jgi:hypothetical protein